MTHEKLVAGTESPTRYTKIIRNPGAGTKYNRTYQQTDYVSRYTKTVAGGKDYEPPAPPEPEYETLAVVEKTTNSNDNVYEIGETVAFTTATYTGGSDSNVYRWRFQDRDHSADDWVNYPWTNYDNTQETMVKVLDKGGQLRFQCQARDPSQDPVPQVNSFGAVCNVPFPPMVVEAPVATGLPYKGETIRCSEPNVTGGLPPYQFDYFWVDESNAMIWEAPYMAPVTIVTDYDVGKTMKCLVTVTDSSPSPNNTTVESNSIGPIEVYTIGDIQLTNSNTDTIIENSDLETIIQGASVTYVADFSGTLPEDKAVWEWKVRSGAVTIRGSSNLPYCTFVLPTEYPGGCTLSVAIYGKAGTDYTDENQTLIWNITYTE